MVIVSKITELWPKYLFKSQNYNYEKSGKEFEVIYK